MATVFYSWQADRPNLTGRNLVQRALEDVVNQLNSDAQVEDAQRDELLLDSDTQGIPGSPPIVEAIFKKIDAAEVFVADLTFVNERVGQRSTPNPNVLIEYGWALKSLTHRRIVAIMNTAYGAPSRETLPFDLGHLRFPLQYHCADDADEATRRQVRRQLAASLKSALGAILQLPIENRALPPPFVRKRPENGRGRFRKADEPIGELHIGGFQVGGHTPASILLSSGPAMWFRVMPQRISNGMLLNTQIESTLRSSGLNVAPLNFSGGQFRARMVRGRDGFGMIDTLGREMASAVVYVFNSGELWTIDTAYLACAPEVVLLDESSFESALLSGAAVLGKLGLIPPYDWIAGLEGVQGRRLQIYNQPETFQTPALPPLR